MRNRMLLGVNSQAGSPGYQAKKQRVLSTRYLQDVKYVSPPLQVCPVAYAVAEY
jgi:hypothetical protein